MNLPEVRTVLPEALVQLVESACSSGDFAAAIALLEAGRDSVSAAVLDPLILDLRIEAFEHMRWAPTNTTWPSVTGSVALSSGLAEISGDALNAETLLHGVVGSGGLIVRDLVDAQRVAMLRAGIDHALKSEHQSLGGSRDECGSHWYRRSKRVARGPVQFGTLGERSPLESESMWAVDSPAMAQSLIELYRELGLPRLLQDYFGEPALLSVKKWVLRRVRPNADGEAGWHQDGRFLGEDIRTVNLWIALSDCGGEALSPGMEIIPVSSRVIHPTGTDGAVFDWTVGPGLVDQIRRLTPVENPRFRPGDALFFDEFNLHRTGFAAHHSLQRYAVESWFFAASRAPAKQFPVLF